MGWDDAQRCAHLHRVVGLCRFLIRPGVVCRNLASHVLGRAARALREDFERLYGYRPWLCETFVDEREHTGASLRAANWVRVGESAGRGRQDRTHAAPETCKAVYLYELEPAWRERLGVSAPGVAPLAPGEGLDAQTWAANEFGGAPLGDARLSARLVESAHHMAQCPMRAITGAANGARAVVKGHYRLIDQPAKSAVTVEHILAPHRARTLQRMHSEHTVLCVVDGTSLNFTRRGQTQGLGVIGSNQTGAQAHGLHLHATLAVNPDGVPLGVLRPDSTHHRPPTPRPPAPRRARRRVVSLGREPARLRPGRSAPARHARGVHHGPRGRFPRPVHRAPHTRTDRRAAGACEGQPRPRQRHYRRGRQGRAAPVRRGTQRPRARELHRRGLSPERARQSQQAGPKRKRPARLAETTLRYKPVALPCPGAEPVALWMVHAREERPPPDVEPLEWFLLTTVPVRSPTDAQRILQHYTLRWRIEDYFRILKSGCKVEELQHHSAERLARAITIKMVIAWRIQLMVRLGREVPELPAEVLFSDIELRVLATFARSRSLAPPQHLGEAVELLARLGGWLGRTRDPPGAQLLWHGYTQLMAMTFAFELRDEYG